MNGIDMRHVRLFVCLFPLLPFTAVAEEPIFRWLRPVQLPELKAAAPIGIPLDEQVHAETRNTWPDLRVRDAKGGNVGFVIEKLKDFEPHPVTKQWAVASQSVKISPEFGMRVQIALDKDDPLPDALVIQTRMRDFELQVQVESTANGKDWTPAGAPVLIFDYSRFIEARNLVLPVSAGDHRTFRLTIGDITAEQENQLLELTRRLSDGREVERTERTSIQRRPFHLDKIVFQRTVQERRPLAYRRQLYRQPTFQIEQAPEKKQTIATIETKGQPVDALRVLTDAQNFSRRYEYAAEVDDGLGRPTWEVIERGALARIAVGTIQREQLVVEGDPLSAAGIPKPQLRRPTKLRLTIENGDSPPLAITAIDALGPIYELRCLAGPGETLQLEYGSDDAKAGNVDVAALQEALKSGVEVIAATLGEPQKNSAASASTGTAWTPWNDTRVVLGVIVLLTVLLGAGLYQASQRMNDQPTPPQEPS